MHFVKSPSRAPNGGVHIPLRRPHGQAAGHLSRMTVSRSYCPAPGRANDRTEHQICVRSDYLRTRDCCRYRASRALLGRRCFEKYDGLFRSGEGRSGPVSRRRREETGLEQGEVGGQSGNVCERELMSGKGKGEKKKPRPRSTAILYLSDNVCHQGAKRQY